MIKLSQSYTHTTFIHVCSHNRLYEHRLKLTCLHPANCNLMPVYAMASNHRESTSSFPRNTDGGLHLISLSHQQLCASYGFSE